MKTDIKLYELAFGCYIYNWFTDYDISYVKFQKEVKPVLDLNNFEHRKNLIKLLNKWGCRQFSIEYHDFASKEILSWNKEYGNHLVPDDKHLWQLSKQELEMSSKAYESLANKIASFRERNGNKYAVSIGATGASKILFNIRPKAYLLWDRAIRDNLEYDGSKDGYLNFLIHVKSILENLNEACQKNGISILDLPKLLGRNESTVLKLIDEYYWVTITNKCTPPDISILKNWIRWK